MNNVLHARKGMKWVLTQAGLEESRVKAKFEVNSPTYKAYSKAVPAVWFQKGYVVEVKEDE